jgi:hypothetical protein
MVRLHVTKDRVTSVSCAQILWKLNTQQILASLASGAELPLWAFRIVCEGLDTLLTLQRPSHEVMFAATDMRVVYADGTTEDMPSIHVSRQRPNEPTKLTIPGGLHRAP